MGALLSKKLYVLRCAHAIEYVCSARTLELDKAFDTKLYVSFLGIINYLLITSLLLKLTK